MPKDRIDWNKGGDLACRYINIQESLLKLWERAYYEGLHAKDPNVKWKQIKGTIDEILREVDNDSKQVHMD